MIVTFIYGCYGIWHTNRQIEISKRLKMKIIEIKTRNLLLIEQLLAVWERSVKATHLL